MAPGTQNSSGNWKLETGNSPLTFRIVEGAGAFVCGEETALIASIQGRRGIPTIRPPYPAEGGDAGLYQRPTLVNNVETYANIPWIVRHGPDAFAALGTPTSKGTKVFALTGKVPRGGLIEVPMGITLHQIIHHIAGATADDGVSSFQFPVSRKDGGGTDAAARRRGDTANPSGNRKLETGNPSIKAVQIGGPSGGCVPASLFHTPIDFESLKSIGAMMGSGGLVVLDHSDCMVDLARYFLAFTQAESCGRCTFCRVGTTRMLEILERLCAGKAQPTDLQKLTELAREVRLGSSCGLGQTAPNPVLSTLQYFPEEYEAHLKGRCPAGKCKNLIQYAITRDCIGCGKCAAVCPTRAIDFAPYQLHSIQQELCTKCDACRTICPTNAVVIQ